MMLPFFSVLYLRGINMLGVGVLFILPLFLTLISNSWWRSFHPTTTTTMSIFTAFLLLPQWPPLQLHAFPFSSQPELFFRNIHLTVPYSHFKAGNTLSTQLDEGKHRIPWHTQNPFPVRPHHSPVSSACVPDPCSQKMPCCLHLRF